MELRNLFKRKFRLILDLLIICMAITIVVYFIFFFIKKENKHFKIGDMAQIELSSFDNKTITLEEIIAPNLESIVLFLKATDCPSCISKGLSELKALKEAGKACFVIVVYDWIEDLNNWIKNYNMDSFLTARKDNFNSHIYTLVLPVIVYFKEYRINSYKFITP